MALRSNTISASHNPAADAASALRLRWNEAIVSVIHLQREFARLMAQPELDDTALDATWLRLFQAQEHERGLARELDHLSD